MNFSIQCAEFRFLLQTYTCNLFCGFENESADELPIGGTDLA